jgi:hypothetical protein
VKEVGSHGEQTYNLAEASVSDLSSWLEEVLFYKAETKAASFWFLHFLTRLTCRAMPPFLYSLCIVMVTL